MKLEQEFVKYFVRFGGNGVSRKIAFEIYWPLGVKEVQFMQYFRFQQDHSLPKMKEYAK